MLPKGGAASVPDRCGLRHRLDVGHDAGAARVYGAITASATASHLAGADAARITEAVATMRARLIAERFEAANAKGAALDDRVSSP